MPVYFQIGAIFVLFILFIIQAILVWQMYSHYNRLTKGVHHRSLMQVLDELVKNLNTVEKDIDFLKKNCDTIKRDGLAHIQKVGLIRFNPFNDTGGDQSFTLALLDRADTGVVVSGLYSRSGTRWYAKKVQNGNGVDHNLSDEEKKAIREAN